MGKGRRNNVDSINRVFQMKIIKDSIYFKVVFCIWQLVHLIAMAQPYTGVVAPIIIIWGMLILIKNVIIDKNLIDKRVRYLLYAFLVSYVVTIIINIKLNLIGNLKTLVWYSILIFVIFITDKQKEIEDVKKDIDTIAKVVTKTTFVMSLVSLLMFVFRMCFWVYRVDGAKIPQGYFAARLWGIFIDPNQGCVVALISIILSIIIIKRKAMKKFFPITNIIIQYCFLILTGSRGGEIAFFFSGICLVYILFNKNNYYKFIKINSIRVIVLVLTGIVLSCTVILTFRQTRKILTVIPKTLYKIEASISGVISEEEDEDSEDEGFDINIDRADVGGENFSNGRIQLWLDGVKLSKYSPVFGFGDRNIRAKAGELTPGSTLEKQFVHNGFIHMLLAGGWLAFLLMMAIIIIILSKSFRIFFAKKEYNEDICIFDLMGILIGILLVTTMFLTEVFYMNSFAAVMFWFFMGNIVYFQNNCKSIKNI